MGGCLRSEHKQRSAHPLNRADFYVGGLSSDSKVVSIQSGLSKIMDDLRAANPDLGGTLKLSKQKREKCVRVRTCFSTIPC